MATRYFLSPSGTVSPPQTIQGDRDEAYLYDTQHPTGNPKLIVDAERLVDIAATVYSEAWKDDPREGEALTRIIRNRAEYTIDPNFQKAIQSTNFWLKVHGEHFVGRGGPKYRGVHTLPLAS